MTNKAHHDPTLFQDRTRLPHAPRRGRRGRLRAARRAGGRGRRRPRTATNFPRGIDDSKKLDLATREAIYGRLQKVARIGVGIASVEEIDTPQHLLGADAGDAAARSRRWGSSRRGCWSTATACREWERVNAKPIVAGDSKCRSIAAASIVAKVTRDRIMLEHSRSYPGYGWETNRGYPTPHHCRALIELGCTPLHRRSFNLVRERLLRDGPSTSSVPPQDERKIRTAHPEEGLSKRSASKARLEGQTELALASPLGHTTTG